MRRASASFFSLAAAATVLAAPAASGPKLSGIAFHVFVKTDLPLSDVTWTGTTFRYATENLGVWSEPADGLPLTR